MNIGVSVQVEWWLHSPVVVGSFTSQCTKYTGVSISHVQTPWNKYLFQSRVNNLELNFQLQSENSTLTRGMGCFEVKH